MASFRAFARYAVLDRLLQLLLLLGHTFQMFAMWIMP